MKFYLWLALGLSSMLFRFGFQNAENPESRFAENIAQKHIRDAEIEKSILRPK